MRFTNRGWDEIAEKNFTDNIFKLTFLYKIVVFWFKIHWN